MSLEVVQITLDESTNKKISIKKRHKLIKKKKKRIVKCIRKHVPLSASCFVTSGPLFLEFLQFLMVHLHPFVTITRISKHVSKLNKYLMEDRKQNTVKSPWLWNDHCTVGFILFLAFKNPWLSMTFSSFPWQSVHILQCQIIQCLFLMSENLFLGYFSFFFFNCPSSFFYPLKEYFFFVIFLQ